MNYPLEVIVRTTNLVTDPASDEIQINRGILTGVTIMPQTYLGGVVKAIILLEGQQLYPTTSGKFYTLVEKTLEIRDNYPLFPKETTLKAICWAVGAYYDHKILVNVNVIPMTKSMRKVG